LLILLKEETRAPNPKSKILGSDLGVLD